MSATPSIEPVEAPQSGQIVVAVPMDARFDRASLVLVTGADSETRTATVALMTPRVRFATDADVRLAREQTGYHVDLLAHADIVGPVWWSQIERGVGQVPVELAESIGDASTDGFSDVPLFRRGMSIRSEDDPRWAFKQAQLEAFRFLAGDCIRQIISGGLEQADLDPALVQEALQGDELALSVLGGTGTSRPRPLPFDILQEILEGNMDLRAFGVDGARIIEQLVMESLSEADAQPSPTEVGWSPARSTLVSWSPVDQLLAYRRAQGETCIRLRTTHSAWEGDEVPAVAVAGFETAILQLNCETEG